jgi:hypothetical protein
MELMQLRFFGVQKPHWCINRGGYTYLIQRRGKSFSNALQRAQPSAFHRQ